MKLTLRREESGKAQQGCGTLQPGAKVCFNPILLNSQAASFEGGTSPFFLR
jgi:hypothetical protein